MCRERGENRRKSAKLKEVKKKFKSMIEKSKNSSISIYEKRGR